MLASGKIDMAFERGGDMLKGMADHPDLHYVIPQEESIIWTDNMCIPANTPAPRSELAKAFINYILDPQIGAGLSNFTHYSSPNQAALPCVNEADQANPTLYLSTEVRQRLFFIVGVGEQATQLYEDAWAEVMVGRKP